MPDICMVLALAFVSPSSGDLHFMYAQEAFVSSVRGAKPPAEVQVIFAKAGDSEYCCREAASAKLRRTEPRWLFWGLWSSDLEVRSRCNQALRQSAGCTPCGRTGFCQFTRIAGDTAEYGKCARCGKHSYGHGHEEYSAPCPECKGNPCLWEYSIFDFPAR